MGKVLLLGATGTIGRAVAAALVDARCDVVAIVRDLDAAPAGVHAMQGSVLDRKSVEAAMEGVETVISCLASRTGVAQDAWAIDHNANALALDVAQASGVGRFVLLSAICVQKPRLAFQHAKLAFEAKLQAASLDWFIVRPTAYFKSLSGQVERVRQGKPFLVFGDGALTATKPISDRDLARFILLCLTEPSMANRILPIGGPGPAMTPVQHGALLFEACGMEPRFRKVPVGMMQAVAFGLGVVGSVLPKVKEKAELARIGHYYATESMLVWDSQLGSYDADATPEFGKDRLSDHFAALISGDAVDDRGTHAVF